MRRSPPDHSTLSWKAAARSTGLNAFAGCSHLVPKQKPYETRNGPLLTKNSKKKERKWCCDMFCMLNMSKALFTRCGGVFFVFVKGTGSCLLSRFAKNVLRERQVQLLTWPPCSPDLSPLVASTGNGTWSLSFTSQLELRSIVRAMSDLDPDAAEKACTTGFTHKCLACVRTRGGHFEHRL